MLTLIKKMSLLIFTATFYFVTLPTLAEDAATDEYQGIEIVVNINTAGIEELDKLLVGVGPSKAQAIVEFREQNGAFTKVEDLMLVKGIGQSLLKKNQQRIRL